jgi:hypothetical protein
MASALCRNPSSPLCFLHVMGYLVMEIIRCRVRDDPARDLDVVVGDEVEMERRFHVEGGY